MGMTKPNRESARDRAFRVAVLIVAPLIVSSCASTPKEKTEYEKKIEAMPMPATEAERVEQCREVQSLARLALVKDVLHDLQPEEPGFPAYDESESPALIHRLNAIDCPYPGLHDQ